MGLIGGAWLLAAVYFIGRFLTTREAATWQRLKADDVAYKEESTLAFMYLGLAFALIEVGVLFLFFGQGMADWVSLLLAAVALAALASVLTACYHWFRKVRTI